AMAIASTVLTSCGRVIGTFPDESRPRGRLGKWHGPCDESLGSTPIWRSVRDSDPASFRRASLSVSRVVRRSCQSTLVRVRHRTGAIADADLGEDVVDVALDRRLADEELACDLGV